MPGVPHAAFRFSELNALDASISQRSRYTHVTGRRPVSASGICMLFRGTSTWVRVGHTVADPGFESRGGGGGAWNSNTPKVVIATRSRRGPALAPSRGSGGMLPREILKTGMRRYAFFTLLGYNFRKIRERICKVICTYIYIFTKYLKSLGRSKKRCST